MSTRRAWLVAALSWGVASLYAFDIAEPGGFTAWVTVVNLAGCSLIVVREMLRGR